MHSSRKDIDEIVRKISRGTLEIINTESLKEKLFESWKSKKSLHVKAGFDPTAPDIHLGHVVLLRKLRQLQDLGHKVFFLIGDFTAQVGDPSGRDQLRPKLSLQQIQDNAKTYHDQVFKILDRKKTEVVFNSCWLEKLTSQQILELTSLSTVAQMLARSDFKSRFEQKKEISILEFIYPLLQGYDSFHLKADIEFGGSDQKFNLLMGRQLQEVFGEEPQVIITTPLLEGTDGVCKMSKSLGNYIGINEPASEMFGKIMSITDELMYRYYELLTDFDLNEIKSIHPKEAKLRLAEEIVQQFYPSQQAKHARDEFERTFSQRKIPDDVIECQFTANTSEQILDILVRTKVVGSKSEVRRLLKQGAITFNGQKLLTEDWKITEGILKIGKRRFLRLIKLS